MEWLSENWIWENWIWIMVIGGMAVMHLFGHGVHGQSGHRQGVHVRSEGGFPHANSNGSRSDDGPNRLARANDGSDRT